MSDHLAGPFHSWLMGEAAHPPRQWQERYRSGHLSYREHGVMPRPIGEFPVRPLVFGHNSHHQIRNASVDLN